MILSLLFSVSLGRLITASQPRLGLTLSGNSTLIITFTTTLLTLSQYAHARWFHSGVHANVRPACRPHLPKVHFGRNQRSRPLQGLVYPPNHSHKPDYIDTTGGVGRAGLTASAWALKMGFVSPHPSLQMVADASKDHNQSLPTELEHQVVMSMVERVIAMIRCRRGLKAIESFEQVHFLAAYVAWLREKAVKQ
jgi:hypothetical protein